MLNELWHSIRALPLWVKLWMLFLGPINVCTIFFLDEPYGIWIAILAYGGMIPLGIIAVIQSWLHPACHRLDAAGDRAGMVAGREWSEQPNL